MGSHYYDSKYHDFEIDDPVLTKHVCSLPVNGGTKMAIKNINNKRMLYCDFNKNDLETSLKALQDKLSLELKQMLGEEITSALFAYIKNAFVLLKEDEGSPFFKNDNGSSKAKSKKARLTNQQQQKDQET